MIRRLAILLLVLVAGGAAAQEAGPAEVRLGFLLTALHDLDPAAGNFSFDANAWIVDPTGRFNPETQLKVFTHGATVTVEDSERLPGGGTYSTINIAGTVEHPFDTSDFPFDRQELRIHFETDALADEMILVADADQSRIADVVAVSGWEIQGLRFSDEIVSYDSSFGGPGQVDFSRVTAIVDIERQRTPLVIEKFIGYTVAMLITVLVYFVPPDQIGVRVGMLTSAIFAAVGNRYSLDTLLGFEAYFGLVDQLSLIVFGAIYVALAVSLAVYRTELFGTAVRARRIDMIAGSVAVLLSFGAAAAAILLARS